ncbi:TetR/AcrR family transcriptional regulator [Leifsonia poae]|uniref:TetR/AcrR family transcriptional regulator n=1 Tax=Leifsonia poae TaxID=110933 RepID=UPI001CBFF388|nr:TetR family transcriptional regulator [Leifsonia poae]
MATDTLTTSPAAAAPGLRERKKQETRDAIHQAALRLVAQNGITATSVDAICSEAVVSSRTFFNYFPSKVAAIIGHSVVQITDAQREEFLAGTGEQNLVRDLCRLLKGITDSLTRHEADRWAFRELLARRPEIVPELRLLVTEIRHQLAELAARRTTPERARLGAALVVSALTSAFDAPLDPRIDSDTDDWLFAAVTEMHDIAACSLPATHPRG